MPAVAAVITVTHPDGSTAGRVLDAATDRAVSVCDEQDGATVEINRYQRSGPAPGLLALGTIVAVAVGAVVVSAAIYAVAVIASAIVDLW